MPLPKRFTLLLLGSWLSGCCMVSPCQSGTGVVGQVQDAAGQPLEGAAISLYGREIQTTRSGCFTVEVASVAPFTLHASAPGYAEVQRHAEYGHYRALITLQRAGSGKASAIAWQPVPEREFRRSGACP